MATVAKMVLHPLQDILDIVDLVYQDTVVIQVSPGGRVTLE